MNIGKFGIWTSYRPFGIQRAGEAARVAEQLGYGAWWVGGSPHIPDIRPILDATSALVAATGILNVWSNDPGETAAADAALRADFPGRFMLGIGIGHPEATSDYRRPLTTMRAFLDGLDASPSPPPAGERCLAALGPRMLDLAAARTAGTHPYFVPVEHTRWARQRLGPGSWWRPRWRAWLNRPGARQGRRPPVRPAVPGHAQLHAEPAPLRLRRGRPRRGGSDRLIDAIIPPGQPRAGRRGRRRAPRRRSRPRLPAAVGERGVPRESWTALAKVLAR